VGAGFSRPDGYVGAGFSRPDGYVGAGFSRPDGYVGAGLSRPDAAPALLSETGIDDPRVRPFSPQYPLWSDGARKSRLVLLPEGARIDATDVDAWEFPDGTRFWKHFEFGGRTVETRMLWKVKGDWVFATYVWNEDRRDAVLAPPEGIPGIVEVAAGPGLPERLGGVPKRHSIPSIEECRACHVTDRPEVLGFTALQLSADRDALAPNAETPAAGAVTTRTLVDEDLLWPRRPELAANPPRIQAADPKTRAVLGMLSANCGNCHNERSSIANLGLLLRQPAYGTPAQVEASIARLLQRTGKWRVPGAATAEASVFVAPGEPQRSGILVRMKSRRPSTQMPPLGTVVPDHAAIDLVASWIRDLSS
jgi:hypothetical protein